MRSLTLLRIVLKAHVGDGTLGVYDAERVLVCGSKSDHQVRSYGALLLCADST